MIKNCINVAVFEKKDEPEENLAPPTRPRYQDSLQNLPIKIRM